MAEALRDAKPLVERGEVLTVGIDSLTFYGESFFTWLKRRTLELNKDDPRFKLDTRALYGHLAEHMKTLRIDLHKWPCNVGWLALEAPPAEDTPLAGPLLIGKAREQFPAGCDHCFLHRAYTAKDEEGNEGRFFEMHTAPWGNYVVGGRDSGQLPPSVFNPTYREFAEYLGLPNPIEAFEQAKSGSQSAPAVRRVVTST
jgi:hypothetical protein